LDNGYPDSYLYGMTHYSVAEAKNNLPKLLDRMLAGEEVVITRRGKPIARLAPQEPTLVGFPLDLEWLDANRITPAAGPVDTASGVAEMRRGYRY
jgi:prevent-host-death family protein